MKVEWSAEAERALIAFSDLLDEVDPNLSRKAREDIRLRVAGLGSRPGKGHNSRWEGLKELSLTRWRKIAVYRVTSEAIKIVAFYDARQDLSKVKPVDER